MTFSRCAAALFLLSASIATAGAEEKAIIVLDGSGSMWGQIDGTPKIAIARDVLATVLTDLPAEPVVANVNVPNCELDQLQGWSITEIGSQPPRAMTKAQLVERDGEPGVFDLDIRSGDLIDLPPSTDGGAVEHGLVSVSYISRFVHEPRDDMGAAEQALASMFA